MNQKTDQNEKKQTRAERISRVRKNGNTCAQFVAEYGESIRNRRRDLRDRTGNPELLQSSRAG